MNQSAASFTQSINLYCITSLNTNNFQEKEKMLDLLNKFLLDWENMRYLELILLEGNNPQSVFVLYQLLSKLFLEQKSIINVPNQTQAQIYNTLEDAEKLFKNKKQQFFHSSERLRAQLIVQKHIQLAIQYFQLAQQFNHPAFTLNTVIFAVTQLIRKSWASLPTPEDLINELIGVFFKAYNEPLMIIGFKFFENLVTSIKQYIYATGYIEYRRVMISFQRYSLQKICEMVVPLLKQSLMESLNKEAYFEALVNLSFSIGTFNFNLSFYELDADTDLKENQVVSFPDYYTAFFYDTSMMEGLFSKIVSLYSSNQQQSVKLLNMMQRFVSTRLSIFSVHGSKKVFRASIWEGLNYLLSKHHLYLNDQMFSSEVASLMIRVMNNLTLRKVQKFEQVFVKTISNLSSFQKNMIDYYGFRLSQQNVCIKIQEIWSQISYQMELHKSLNELERKAVLDMSNNYFKMVIQHLFEGSTFFLELPDQLPVKKFKKMLLSNFQPFVSTFKSQFQENIQQINIYASQICSMSQNFTSMSEGDRQILFQKWSVLFNITSGIVLYSTQTEYSTGFEYYVHYSKEKELNIQEQNKLVHLALTQINNSGFYLEIISNVARQSKWDKIYLMSMLIFIESFLQLTLDNLQYDEATKTIKTTSQMYDYLVKANLCPVQFNLVLETILEKCFQIFSLTDSILIEFSLKLIQQLYQKVKRSIPRNIFKRCKIPQLLQDVFQQLDITCFQELAYIKKRREIYHIISLVWIDDQNDDYINSLINIYSKIKSSIDKEASKIGLLKYLWDLIGLAEQIEVENIYRIFLKLIYPDINQLLSQQSIQLFAQDYDTSIALLTLMKQIFTNKNMRLSSENIQLILYQLYAKVIDYFMVLSQYLVQQNSTGNQKDFQLTQLKQLIKLIRLMNETVLSKSINAGFFLFYRDPKFKDLFLHQIQIIQVFRFQLKDFPKYRNSLYEFFGNLVSEQVETLVFECDTSTHITVLTICRDTISDIINIQQQKGEEKITEDSNILQIISTLLMNFLTFFFQESLIGSQTDIQNIQAKLNQIRSSAFQIYSEIYDMTFQVAVNYYKIAKIQLYLPDILFIVSLLNPQEFHTKCTVMSQKILQQITLKTQILESINQTYSNLEFRIDNQAQTQFTKNIKILLNLLQEQVTSNIN